MGTDIVTQKDRTKIEFSSQKKGQKLNFSQEN